MVLRLLRSPLVLLLVAVMAVATAVGFRQDATSFGSNLLAEAVGLAASVLVAVFVADRLVDRRRRDQWGQVASATMAAIADRLRGLSNIVIEIVLLPHDDDLSKEESLEKALSQIAVSIRQHRDALASSGPEDPDRPGQFTALPAFKGSPQEMLFDIGSSKLLLNEVQKETGFLYRDVTPRTLELGTDTDLVALLLALETAERVWAEGVRLVVDDWGYPEEYAWAHAADFYEAASRLAAHIVQYEYVDSYTEAMERARLLASDDASS